MMSKFVFPSAVLWLTCMLVAMLYLPMGLVVRSVLLSPWVEEIVFRWGLQSALSRRVTPDVANVATALAFTVCHALLQPSLMSLLTLLPALVLGAVFQRTGRLMPCVALHALANLIWTLALAPLLYPLLRRTAS
jgi:membrane protease YdiL (CAAX protease family)